MAANPSIGSDSTVPEERHRHGEAGSLGGLLKKVGLSTERIRNSNVGHTVGASMTKARGYARSNPGAVLGGLAAAAIAFGLMRKRRHNLT